VIRAVAFLVKAGGRSKSQQIVGNDLAALIGREWQQSLGVAD
jgi:hypothetical protein